MVPSTSLATVVIVSFESFSLVCFEIQAFSALASSSIFSTVCMIRSCNPPAKGSFGVGDVLGIGVVGSVKGSLGDAGIIVDCNCRWSCRMSASSSSPYKSVLAGCEIFDAFDKKSLNLSPLVFSEILSPMASSSPFAEKSEFDGDNGLFRIAFPGNHA